MRTIFGIFLLIQAFLFAIPVGAAEFSWKSTEGTVALEYGSNTVWCFHYGKELTKPYFDPIGLPDGTSLSWVKPSDHPWHYGLWFSFKYINKVNYWEEDKKTGQPAGRTEWDRVAVLTNSDMSAGIEMSIKYHPGDNDTVLTEKRQITITSPAKDGSYRLDWTSELTAVKDVVLDRTPLAGQEGGKPWGGYAGLSFRMKSSLSERVISTIEGNELPTTANDKIYKSSGAMDYSAMLDGKLTGVAIIDSASNVRHPTPWYAIKSKDMNFFNAAFLCHEPMKLAKGEILKLKYRIIVHPGTMDKETLLKESKDF